MELNRLSQTSQVSLCSTAGYFVRRRQDVSGQYSTELSNTLPKPRGAQHSYDYQNGFVSYTCYRVCIEMRDVY